MSKNKISKSDKFYVATKTFQGGMGRVKKGELYISTGKAQSQTYYDDEDEPYKVKEVFVELADPHYEYYEGLDPADFKRFFREVDPGKDTAAMKKLNKWGYVKFGDTFWVAGWTMYRGETPIEAATRVLSNLKEETAPDAIKAGKKAGGAGTSIELKRGVIVLKKWADMFKIILDEKNKDITPKKLVNLLKKGGRTMTGKEVKLLESNEAPGGILLFEQYFESLNEREFSKEEREELADKGEAMPDGSYPIETVEDLKNAIQAFGRAKDKAATKKFIIKRAKAMGEADLLPEDWN